MRPLSLYPILAIVTLFLCCENVWCQASICDDVIEEIRMRIDSTNLDRSYEEAINRLIYGQDICPPAKQKIISELFLETYAQITAEKDRAVRLAKISEYRRLLAMAVREIERKDQLAALDYLSAAYELIEDPDSELDAALDYLFRNSIDGKIPIVQEEISRTRETPLAGITGDGNFLLRPGETSYEVVELKKPEGRVMRKFGAGQMYFSSPYVANTSNQSWLDTLYAPLSVNKLKNRILVGPNGNCAAALYDLKGDLVTELSGVDYTVSWVTFSAGGEAVVVVTSRNKLKVFDLQGVEQNTLGEEDEIREVYVSVDDGIAVAWISITHEQEYTDEYGQQSVYIYFENKIKVWTLEGELISESSYDNDFPSFNVAFSPIDDKFIVYGNQSLQLMNFGGQLIKQVDLSEEYEFIAHVYFLSEDGKFVLETIDRKQNIAPFPRTYELYDSLGNALCKFPAHFEASEDIVAVPGTDRLLIGQGMAGLGIWNCSCDSLAVLPHSSYGFDIAVSVPQNRIITFVSVDELRVWDLDGNPIRSINTDLVLQEPLQVFPDKQFFNYSTEDSYFLDMDGELLGRLNFINSQFIWGGDGMVEEYTIEGALQRDYRIWKFHPVPFGQIETFREHLQRMNAVRHQGELFIETTVSTWTTSHPRVRHWDSSRRLLKDVNFNETENITTGVDCPIMFIWDSEKKQGRLWNVMEDRYHNLDANASTDPMNVYFNTKYKRIIAQFLDYSIRVWSFTGELLFSTTPSTMGNISVYNGDNPVFMGDNLSMSADTSQLFVRYWDDCYYMDIANDTIVKLIDYGKWTTGIIFNPTGGFITGSWDGRVISWDQNGSKIDEEQVFTTRVEALCVDSAWTLVAVSSGDKLKIIELEETNFFSEARSIELTREEYIQSLSFAPDHSKDDRLIIQYYDDQDIISSNGQLFATLPTKYIETRFSPSGDRITQKDRNTKSIRLYNSDYQLIKEIPGASQLTFNPNGTTFMARSENDTDVLLFDWDGKLLNTLTHEENLRGIEFSPSGRMILTLEMNTAKLWDEKGKLLGQLDGHDHEILSLDFIDNESRVLSVSADGRIIFWPTPETARLWLEELASYPE